MNIPAERLRVVLVTGLSGGGKASVLRALEDIGYEAVDNPPLGMLEEMVTPGDRKLAIGVDARTRGFDSGLVLAALARLRANPALRPELVYACADEPTLLRRYTESRRRHPLAPQGPVADGIAAEQSITASLRDGADLVIDTSDLPLAGLRQLIERHFGSGSDAEGSRLVVSLVSFAFPRGLPREADLVFDARFLRNPHYDPILRTRTGLDQEVGAYVASDPDCENFFTKVAELVDMLLPRFVQEGKKYATVAIGCTGGRHRSVYLIERLASYLAARSAASRATGGPGHGWRLHVTHRELAQDGHEDAYLTNRTVAANHPPSRQTGADFGADHGAAASSALVQAREA